MPAVPDLTSELVKRIRWVQGHADVWGAFADPALFPRMVGVLAAPFRDAGVTKAAGVEARGFALAAAVAVELGAGFVAIRKEAGLFPGAKLTRRTPPDYRGLTTTLRLQAAALACGDRVLLVDDWAETGSQAQTARALIEEAGAGWAGLSVVVDQLSAAQRAQLAPVHALIPAAALGPNA
jgi:adenine phosphoribosyltransferase